MAKQVDYKAVGLRIKTLRLKNNIYQTELAKNIGVSQTHMSNIESGRAGLTLENLVKMTNIFNGRLQVQIEQDLSSNYISGIHLIKKSVEQFIRSVVA